MHMRRTIIGFVLRLLILYALLAAPWPGLRKAYARGYRAIAGVLFYEFGPAGRVKFTELPNRADRMDTRIRIINTRNGQTNTADHSADLYGFMPTAEIIALVLATPIPWPRRFKSLLLALALLQVVLVLRLTLMLLFGFSGSQPWCQFAPGPFWMTVLSGLYTVCLKWTSFSFVVPVFVWIAATVRRGDLERWRGLQPAENAQPRPERKRRHMKSPDR